MDTACHKTGSSLIPRAFLFFRLSPLPNSSFKMRELDCMCVYLFGWFCDLKFRFVVRTFGPRLLPGCQRLWLRSVNQAVASTVAVVTERGSIAVEFGRLSFLMLGGRYCVHVTSQSERIRGWFLELGNTHTHESVHRLGTRVTWSGFKFLTGTGDFSFLEGVQTQLGTDGFPRPAKLTALPYPS